MTPPNISVINQRGRVVWVPPIEAKKLVEEKGFRFIHGPKAEYYPQYDKDSKREVKRELVEGRGINIKLEVESL